MELIEREALAQAVKLSLYYCSGYPTCSEADYEYECAMHDARNKVLAALEKAPAIDAAPVVHGRWIECDDDIYTWIKCSECGFEQDIDDDGEHPHEVDDYKLCPACGARMDGGEDDAGT